MGRAAESVVLLRDMRNGNWFGIFSNRQALLGRDETPEARDARAARGVFPIHDLAHTEGVALIVSNSAFVDATNPRPSTFMGNCLMVSIKKELDYLGTLHSSVSNGARGFTT